MLNTLLYTASNIVNIIFTFEKLTVLFCKHRDKRETDECLDGRWFLRQWTAANGAAKSLPSLRYYISKSKSHVPAIALEHYTLKDLLFKHKKLSI